MPSPAYAAVPQPQFLLRYEGNFTDSSTNGNNGINSG